MAWPTPATPVTPCVEWTQPSGTPSPLLDAAQFYTAARRNAGACPCGPVIARLRHMTVRAPLALRAETTPYVSPQLKTVNREGRCVEVLSLLKYENRSSHFQPSNINSNYSVHSARAQSAAANDLTGTSISRRAHSWPGCGAGGPSRDRPGAPARARSAAAHGAPR